MYHVCADTDAGALSTCLYVGHACALMSVRVCSDVCMAAVVWSCVEVYDIMCRYVHTDVCMHACPYVCVYSMCADTMYSLAICIMWAHG